MFINKAILATLFTIVIALSMIGVNFAYATKKVTTQDSLSSYPSIPITAGAEGTTDDNPSSHDGPPPAVLHKDESSSVTSHSTNFGDSGHDGPPPAVLHKDESSSATSHNTNSQDSYSPTVKTHSIPEKDLKNFSKCRANAASDGDVTPAEVMSCFHQGI
ncbi:MAG TPA: hypothetical protein VJ729_07250 [Nitrososphaeraceae archaeon]|nr:hypothetical protein [Nitrososphaeraceae archaeon]